MVNKSGLLWEKLWHRDKKVSPPDGETPVQKKKRLKKERLAKRKQAFESKESYRWVEAFQKIEKLFADLKIPIGGSFTKIIHVFESVGDIAEVFLELDKILNTGVVVRAAHNRCLEGENSYLWSDVMLT